MDLSNDQAVALKRLMKWYTVSKEYPYVTLGGYAGTGKTTLVAILREQLRQNYPDLRVAFCSYTGKATRVLKTKLNETKTLLKQDKVGTIHSLIYSPLVNSNEEIIGWDNKEELECDLIIVDEASMVDEMIWRDLTRYKVPIIAVGDHGQLPPINGSFNLMEKPQIMLSEIHRQAKENPIIELSIMAREYGEIPAGNYANNVKKLSKEDYGTSETVDDLLQRFDNDTLILCGYNNTRVRLNKHIRNAREIEGDEPRKRDRVICLRNNHAKDIYNGMLGTIKSIIPEDEGVSYFAEMEMDGEAKNYKGVISATQFHNPESQNFTNKRAKSLTMDLFDFGYALTVHKAQGSQSRRVILFEERFSQMDDQMWRRWLYTAVTRAESELFIIG